MQQAVLVLNADHVPLRVVPWQRAICLILEDKAMMLAAYAHRALRSATQTFPHPAVVALHRYCQYRHRVRFTRANVLARDGYTCQYCGRQPVRASGPPDLAQLTIDHVVPRAQADAQGRVVVDGRVHRVTSWHNVTTACADCNGAKAARTPQEAGMSLRRAPRVPTPLDMVWMAAFAVDVPEEWMDYLPASSPWRGYWTVELDDD